MKYSQSVRLKATSEAEALMEFEPLRALLIEEAEYAAQRLGWKRGWTCSWVEPIKVPDKTDPTSEVLIAGIVVDVEPVSAEGN